MEGLVRSGFNPPGEAEPDTPPLDIHRDGSRSKSQGCVQDNESLFGSERRGGEFFGSCSYDGGVCCDGSDAHCVNKASEMADYESIGQPVSPTMFLPMKTPMSREIIENWSLEDPPRHVLTIGEYECLYQDDLPEGGLEYAHVQLVAKVLPSKDAVDEVECVAKEFWSRHPDQYIAIHCAYGFNRTGFIVCSYLCQAHGMTVIEALASFAEARPPGVKHGKFIDELYARYGGTPRVVRSVATSLLKAELASCQGCDEEGSLSQERMPAWTRCARPDHHLGIKEY
eukprot:jgi/Picre1/30168/NNA_005537.t1